MEFKDQLNRIVSLEQTPRRIVSLVPSQTELLVGLGLEEKIVGITKFCVHPKNLKQSKAIVGGTKQINISKIEALAPEVILCNKEENTLEMVEQLEQIAPVHVSDILDFPDTLELIKQYGQIFDCEHKAAEISGQIGQKLNDFKNFIESKEPLKAAYFIWKDPWMVAANQTFINSILKLNKFKNIFEELERYPEIDLANDNLAEADVILLSSEPYPFKSDHVEFIKALHPKSKPILVDGEFFSWYGTRMLKAFDYFKALRERLEI